jgi:hypothetical protein
MNRRRQRSVLIILAVCGVILGSSASAFAQQATISGTVTDTSGGVLPGVTITVVHEETGNTFEGVTDGQGQFRIPVRVGAHRLTASRLLLQMGNAVGVNGQFGVGREASINLGGKHRELRFQLGDEFLPCPRHTKSIAIGRKARLACCPGQKLGPVVTEILCSGNVDVSDLQGLRQNPADALDQSRRTDQ